MNEYLRGTILERVPSKIMMGLADDDPVYKGYRLALVSASKEESVVRIIFFSNYKISIYCLLIYLCIYKCTDTHICLYIYYICICIYTC